MFIQKAPLLSGRFLPIGCHRFSHFCQIPCACIPLANRVLRHVFKRQEAIDTFDEARTNRHQEALEPYKKSAPHMKRACDKPYKNTPPLCRTPECTSRIRLDRGGRMGRRPGPRRDPDNVS